MEKEKYTKKATARILKEVLKVNPKASGFTTLDQAFTILMDHWDLELGIESIHVNKRSNNTVLTLYRDGDKVETWDTKKDLWDSKEGDFDWNFIYKLVLENIIRLRLYKRPKVSKRTAKVVTREPVEEVVTKSEIVTPTPTLSVSDLRKKRDNLSVKIWDWKKKGKDVTELEKELVEIKAKIKELK